MTDRNLSASLRVAFAGELAQRVPRLLEAGDRLTGERTAASARAVVADVHALASSATVVGELAAARLARDCEERLQPYCLLDEDDRLPAEVAVSARSVLTELLGRLSTWSRARV